MLTTIAGLGKHPEQVEAIGFIVMRQAAHLPPESPRKRQDDLHALSDAQLYEIMLPAVALHERAA